ncbi:50S ribosomal protein L28 [Candidatus Nomurabacteria bacterium]|uniref:Large ribosomal subunit protein bL28 n=1 Tax=Candidatus Dojkabacteria bacterium TaxID=2099670 RepID=A0A955KWR2_9BACT|nr:50S ribosomal protein L28 [Candidatus Dojkabacteria bacterium]MCB9789751.1 50S ribosomal protein L28 [Candidatus Nomurabacteria bacterium]MCB9803848.1 50S ribosomal protein L28 [Candidatus Nomurabacteria bacterium]
MAKYCELCEKQTVAGRRIQHHHSIQWRFRAPRTTRTFKPNVRKVKMDVDGKVKNVSVCMKCYKRMRKDLAELEQEK